jgi:hypothetical protein
MNADNILFRCSSLGYLMTEPRDKSAAISETTIKHLVDVFVSAKYGRREEITSKFLDKGNEREQDAITLVSLITKDFFVKNTERLFNEYIQGEPDMYRGEHVRKAEITRDTKCSWSAHTFFRAKMAPVDKQYWWQAQGYMALTGAATAFVDYCLVNGTAHAILEEKRRASYKYGIDCEQDEAYIEECRQIERNHIFDMEAFQRENIGFDFHSNLNEWRWDIPKEERHFAFVIKRDEVKIQQLYQRIRDCRDWMNAHLFKHNTVAV